MKGLCFFLLLAMPLCGQARWTDRHKQTPATVQPFHHRPQTPTVQPFHRKVGPPRPLSYYRGVREAHRYSLPFGYKRYYYRGLDYFFWSGFWYLSLEGGYKAVQPPVGLWVLELPLNCDTFTGSNGVIYYESEGTYYIKAAGPGYFTAQPPE